MCSYNQGVLDDRFVVTKMALTNIENKITKLEFTFANPIRGILITAPHNISPTKFS